MLGLYYGPGACSMASHIVLEDCGEKYEPIRMDLAKGEQRTAEYLQINPAGLIPAIVDPDGPGGKPLKLSQSGAIILYAADKSGRLMPKDAARRAMALQWFMQGATDVAATSGALFRVENSVPEKLPANTDYFVQRMIGFFAVCDAHLATHEYFADELSVADLMLYPNYATRKPMLDKAGGLPNLHRWGAALAARPAIQRGMKVLG
jgi:GST-like protein